MPTGQLRKIRESFMSRSTHFSGKLLTTTATVLLTKLSLGVLSSIFYLPALSQIPPTTTSNIECASVSCHPTREGDTLQSDEVLLLSRARIMAPKRRLRPISRPKTRKIPALGVKRLHELRSMRRSRNNPWLAAQSARLKTKTAPAIPKNVSLGMKPPISVPIAVPAPIAGPRVMAVRSTPVQPAQLFSGYIWPAQGTLTSRYGWRWGRMHRGIDIAAPHGTLVKAAGAGVVSKAKFSSGGYGNLVEIQHPNGSKTLYAHNSQILVRQGQTVAQGEVIAKVGSTGYSTGPHLHFEIHPPGKGAVNPLAYLPK